jgi:HEAT repeat protein
VNRMSTVGAFALILSAVQPGFAQSPIAQRVAAAPDGVVRMQFASRPGACGDGRETIGYRKAFFMGSMQSYGDWSASQCVPGPVRVALSVTNGRVTAMQTYVGGTWAKSSERVTDLGVVSPTDAGAYLFGLIPQLEPQSRRERLFLGAVLADDPATVDRLTNLARDAARREETRRQAIQWIGLLGDKSQVPTLLSFVRSDRSASAANDDDDDQGPGEEGLATAAVAALSFLEDGAGVPALIDLAHTGAGGVRRSAVFWLGQTHDERAAIALHAIIESTAESEAVRSRAIFSLTHGGLRHDAEFAYLRNIFPRLTSERLKDAVLMGMAEDHSGSSWLLDRARDNSEALEVRKKALFWAGQREATTTKDIADFFRTTKSEELRKHAIFVLSQRNDDAAVTELLRIAREDSDREMRSKALFWLAQKDDPRVTKLISDRVSH